MKALAVVVLLPFLSVVILSLYEMGGPPQIAAILLLVASVGGLLLAVVRGRRVTSEKP